MATLVNKMNREVKVIIPNMREFRVFYSDNEGSVMFFKRDWVEVREEHWKPSEKQMEAFSRFITYCITQVNTGCYKQVDDIQLVEQVYEHLKNR